jgi:hypothetical protein
MRTMVGQRRGVSSTSAAAAVIVALILAGAGGYFIGISQTSTVTTKSLSAGTALLSYSGSGNANSPPFTATTSTVKVSMNVTSTSGNPALSATSLYVYPTGGNSNFVTQVEASGQVGSSSFFGYNFTLGQSYFVKVVSQNANWQIIVQPMQ